MRIKLMMIMMKWYDAIYDNDSGDADVDHQHKKRIRWASKWFFFFRNEQDAWENNVLRGFIPLCENNHITSNIMKDLPYHSSWAKNRDQCALGTCHRKKMQMLYKQHPTASGVQPRPRLQDDFSEALVPPRSVGALGPLRRRPFSRLFPGKRPISPARPPLGSKRPIPACFNYRSTCPGRNGWFLMVIEGDFRSTRLPEIGGFVPASARHFPMTWRRPIDGK